MNEEQNGSPQATSKKGSTKNIIIITAFLLLFIAIVAVALAKLSNHFKSSQMAQNPYANTNSTVTVQVVSPTGMMPNAAAKDTSNTQIDKDLQDAQGNLNKLDSDVNNVDQGLNNSSQDIPQ